MPLPPGLDKVTVTGKYVSVDGTPLTGTVEFIGPKLLVDTANNIVLASSTSVTLDSTGAFSVVLCATDAANVTPTGFLYQVLETVGGIRHRYYVSLPKANTPVDISDIINIADFM